MVNRKRRNLLIWFDMFGYTVSLNNGTDTLMNNGTDANKHKTVVGGALSLVIQVMLVIYTITMCQSLYQRK
jgi:hypothetical protein